MFSKFEKKGGKDKSGKVDMPAEIILGEEEAMLKEKNPSTWVNTEDVGNEYYADAWRNLGVGNDEAEVLENEFENEYDPLKLEARNKQIQIEGELRQEREKERDERKERREKEALESNMEITLSEYKSLKEATDWSNLMGMDPELKTGHPVDLMGKKLDLEKIRKEANLYRDIKNNPKLKSNYTPFELELMKKCGMWNFLYRKVNEAQKTPMKPPMDPRGGIMSDKVIKEQVRELNNLRAEHPDQFAELKFQNKEWLKDEFEWKVSQHQGKTQWICVKSIGLKHKDGTKEKLATKYVVTKIPAGFTPKDFKQATSP